MVRDNTLGAEDPAITSTKQHPANVAVPAQEGRGRQHAATCGVLSLSAQNPRRHNRQLNFCTLAIGLITVAIVHWHTVYLDCGMVRPMPLAPPVIKAVRPSWGRASAGFPAAIQRWTRACATLVASFRLCLASS
jgi:hypothetical protein